MRRILLAIAFISLSAAVWSAGPADVLVIINDNSAASKEIGAYYVAKRKVPARNVVHIKCPTEETIDPNQYLKTVEKPIKDYLNKTGLKDTVDYLVLTKGVPIRLGRGWSVDGLLMVMYRDVSLENNKVHALNPYYGQQKHFSAREYGFYLATRLDGYTVKDAKALVDRSLAARPQEGKFMFDRTPQRDIAGYRDMNLAMADAHYSLIKKGYKSILDDKLTFVGGQTGLMGYFSWGSNDASFDRAKYRSNRFYPGAIAETAVSTSARTLNKTNDGGQSLIADLIEAGVTGVKGYTLEPMLDAIADPKIMFDRYTSGYNLAESFYMASRFIFWRDIVIGDPLCAPYAKSGK